MSTVELALALALAAAPAQIVPSRAYFGVDRPIPVMVHADAEPARLELLDPDQEQPVSTAPVIGGGANLASLFPSLWERRSPEVRYVQLVVADRRVGPPLVLVPMVNPPVPMLYDREVGKPWYVDPGTGKPNDAVPTRSTVIFTPDEAPCFSGYYATVDRHVVMRTSQGEVEFRLRWDAAPNTCRNFADLVGGGFYTDVIFHRVVPLSRTGHPFVVQVGDPSGTGDGGPGYNIDLEKSTLPHDFGVLSMARNTDPNTNGSQVFICLSREGTARLDGLYTAFAQAVRGEQTILDLASVPLLPDAPDRPKDPPVLQEAVLVDAPPYGESPTPVRRPTTPAPGR